MPARSEKQRRFFYLVKATQQGKVSPKKVGTKVSKAAKSMSHKDVDDFTKGKNLPKQKLKEMVESIKNLIQPSSDLRYDTSGTSFSSQTPIEPMTLENDLEGNTEQNPIAKTFTQTGDLDQYVGRFSGLELKPKEIDSVLNYSKNSPTNKTDIDKWQQDKNSKVTYLKYESSDFNNNTTTIILKQRSGNDLVFTAFQTTQQQQDPTNGNPNEENKIMVSKSRSFQDEIGGGDVLSNLLQSLEI